MPASISKTTVSRVQTRSQTRAEAQATFDPKNSLRKRDVKTAVKPATRSKTARITKNVRRRAERAPKGVARLAVAQKQAQLAPQTKLSDAREETPASTPEFSTRSSPGNDSVSDDDGSPYDEAYLAEQRRAAISDLHDIVTFDGSCLKDFYKATASDRRIKNFLTASALYDYGTNTWTGISREVRDEKTLRASLLEVIKTIVAGLGNVKGNREVVDTYHTAFPHCEDASQTSKPSISIRATGPSFSEPWVPQGANRVPNAVGFSNVATVFEVKRDVDATEAAVDQLAVYNRQIFFHQLNRLFCRSLLLTETQVRLLHCDRSGAYKTTAVNIHDDPCTFVRLVLGLSSPHETVLGLDSTVQWTIKGGMKVAGTITTVNGSGKRIKYQLRMDEPHAVRRTVRSRGTVCWNAKDKNGNLILLKDSWRLDEQVPEYTFLERAKGVAGVAQMFAPRLSARGFFDFEANDFRNRTMSRVTMACYGSSLDRFTSQRQAIAALRDAIQGHWNLLKAGVMHRDVSMDNILLGDDNAGIGERGMLIDLDMATVVDGPTAGMLTEYRVGTHLYQSVSVLENSDDDTVIAPVPRDYLDDLESFFYVLCHLIYGYKGVDHPDPDAFRGLTVLAQWEQDRLKAAHAKAYYLGAQELNARRIPSFWSVACVELCDSFRKFISPIGTTKSSIRSREDASIRRKLSQDLHNQIDTHYAFVISLFDNALATLNGVGGDAPRFVPLTPRSETPSSTPSANSISDSGNSSRKRRSSDSEDDSIPAKRRRSDDSDSEENTSTYSD
ncbi:hypothetical protein DFP72DRAFT_881589 [Ephemerocybe angulata]|uniref:Fungal-type protein kinase domain-containing protein n=1 Tax=Ephemerocybe angulata TaxID=980116 RepID=A0A8H6I8H3_9AGAR|nr:hypothetical protein DFP72DRAFT_881589 [Tulosesus angulatus]